MKQYNHAKDFENCDICSSKVAVLEYDSPLFCEKCISEMEKMDLSPKKYRKYLELKGILQTTSK